MRACTARGLGVNAPITDRGGTFGSVVRPSSRPGLVRLGLYSAGGTGLAENAGVRIARAEEEEERLTDAEARDSSSRPWSPAAGRKRGSGQHLEQISSSSSSAATAAAATPPPPPR